MDTGRIDLTALPRIPLHRRESLANGLRDQLERLGLCADAINGGKLGEAVAVEYAKRPLEELFEAWLRERP